MSNVIDLINKHFQIWSDTNPESRRKAIGEVYSENCLVYDPFYPETIVGYDGLMTLIDEVQAKFLHFHFGIIPDSLEEHHGQVKVSWYFGPSDNPHTISGQDFMYIKNGLVQSLY